MTRLLVATTNPHKLREIRDLLAGSPVELVGLDALPPIEEPEETGETFEENARLKALYYDRSAKALRHTEKALRHAAEALRHTDDPQRQTDRKFGAALQGCDLTAAEDSGLEIDALGGEPGVRSARFLRPDASYPDRFAEIYRRLAERHPAPRTARFVCALAVACDGGIIFETRGVVEGEIAPEPRGTNGFGYDPIFFYPPYGSTLAEVASARKLHVAHRGQAFRALAAWLRERHT